jgi:hypothetical protein
MYRVSYDPTYRFEHSAQLNKNICIKAVTNGFNGPIEQSNAIKKLYRSILYEGGITYAVP